ncbi:putative glycosyltransferase [Streptomyces sp. NBRC 110611]|uniref:glycosyltransferase n=1 Tax=Streptomyces sp. NBRC 110611 TaxID=1621259 RepID=UPI00082B4AD1|nr:glycosyltransferase [Streptomyces sp. NBRC 110611]GAU70182.1 putative glycosyltransferase [Streptomyces sp. NBRC 110611]
MRALLVTHGSRGDVQPFVALARGLSAAGHDVSIIGPRRTFQIARSAGIPYVPVADGPLELLNDPVIVKVNQSSRPGPVLAMRWFLRNRPRYVQVLEELIAAVRAQPRPDVILFQPWVPAHHIAESLDVPAVPVCLQPGWVPTPDFPNPLLATRIPRALNKASYASSKLTVRLLYGSTIDRVRRQELGLLSRRGRHNMLRSPDGKPVTVLQPFSPHVLPETRHYPPTTHTTGFWRLPTPRGWSAPPRLARFLEAGRPPVYIGFGSLTGSNPLRLREAVIAAVRQAGVRAVVATGWGGVAGPGQEESSTPEEIFFLDEVPHDQLFPHMAAVVHHGGAGTTAAALAAGRPQVVCPFGFDQPFWARRMRACGVAPPPLPQHRLTAERLAVAVDRAVRDTGMAQRAEHLGVLTRAQDGVAEAVEVLENMVARARGVS